MSGIEISVGRAHDYVAAAGSPLDLLFLDTLLHETTATELLAALAGRQDEQGAFAPFRGDAPADLHSTADGLERLDALGLLDHPLPERACAYLLKAQAEDGGFGDVSLPEDDRIALTGRLAGLLAKTPFARRSVLERADAFLSERWQIEKVQGPTYEPILAYMHLLTQMNSEQADEVLQWCGRELERGFRMGVFKSLATARVFLRARAKALPGAQIEASELVTGLITEQSDDGSFEPTTPTDHRVDATLEGVEALLRLS